MIPPDKEIILKDGRRGVLKSPDIGDAQEMLDYLRATAEETEFVLRYPEECKETLEAEEKFLENALKSPFNVMIACKVDDKVAGNCSLSFHALSKVRHRASVAIAILKEYWGLGIGTAMFDAMIALCREKNISQMELEFIEGNDRARALYEKMGFRIYGERPRSIKLKNGDMRSEILMLREMEENQ